MPAPLPPRLKKRSANLTLTPERLRFAQAYAAARCVSVSEVVDELLGALEGALAQTEGPLGPDPLDGLLVDWPAADQKELRQEQHEARLAR